jgi:hypothetical protein
MGDIWDQIVGGRPDDPSKKGPQVRRCREGERYNCFPLEDRAGWYLTHWIGTRTRPCLGDACICRTRDTPIKVRWSGWLLVAESLRPLVVRLLALTENCWDTCEFFRLPDTALRGRSLTLTRPRGGQKGRVFATVSDPVPSMKALPKLPYTHRDQLLRVWFSVNAEYDEFSEYAHTRWLRPAKVAVALPSAPEEEETE